MPRLASGAFIVSGYMRRSLSAEASARADASCIRVFLALFLGLVAIELATSYCVGDDHGHASCHPSLRASLSAACADRQ